MNNLRSHLIGPERILLIVLFAAGSALSLVPPVAGQTVTGSGTAGDIAKFTGANTIGNSIIIENANKIGIGTATPTSKLTVQGSASNPIVFGKNSGTGPGIRAESVGGSGTIAK